MTRAEPRNKRPNTNNTIWRITEEKENSNNSVLKITTLSPGSLNKIQAKIAGKI
jgi:hypothetical protein